MTLEIWFKRVCLDSKDVPDGAQWLDVADFWLRAFVAEIDKRAASVPHARAEVIGQAFDAVTKELLGE